MSAHAALASLATALALVAQSAAAEPPEPPPEADPSSDYVLEPADTLESGSFSYSYGVSGSSGGRVARRRAMRFQGDSLEAGLRDGDGEAYPGGDVSARRAGRALVIGRIAPRWGLGLLLGSSPPPWTSGAGPLAVSSRSGEGVACAWTRLGVEAVCGQFGKRGVGGVAWRGSRAGLGLIADRWGNTQASVALATERRAVELAIDRSGRWRAEGGVVGLRGGTRLALRVRAGHERFRSLAEPTRVAPSRAVSATLEWDRRPISLEAAMAAWRFASEAPGARAMAEAAWRYEPGGTLTLGFEERHGTRRPLAAKARNPDLRQGAWIEWRGETPALALTVREEEWGRQALARDAVRHSLGASAEVPLPRGARLQVAHTLYRARAGEALYVPERDADRWVLRALSGAGRRTRVGLSVPIAEGFVQTALDYGGSRRPSRPHWSVQWSRRMKVKRGR